MNFKEINMIIGIKIKNKTLFKNKKFDRCKKIPPPVKLMS
tara:strand:- start:49 stop:168 length:120 start_codon:yes stop_codon:yes gene_type:complete